MLPVMKSKHSGHAPTKRDRAKSVQRKVQRWKKGDRIRLASGKTYIVQADGSWRLER